MADVYGSEPRMAYAKEVSEKLGIDEKEAQATIMFYALIGNGQAEDASIAHMIIENNSRMCAIAF